MWLVMIVMLDKMSTITTINFVKEINMPMNSVMIDESAARNRESLPRESLLRPVGSFTCTVRRCDRGACQPDTWTH